MNPLIRSAFLLLGSASLLPAATTQLLNVDFGSGTVKSGAAVLGTTGDIWNGINGANSIGLDNTLNWADGTAGSTIKLSQTVGTYSGSFNLGGGDDLMHDYFSLYALGANGPVTFQLSGLTANSILTSIVLYGTGDASGQNASFTINGITQTTTAAGGNSAALSSGVNYVTFTNVLVDSAGKLDIKWENPTGGNDFSGINGMQIAVPEPSAALLGGLGMLALLRRRR